jgi:hypothetical protein
MCNVDDRWFCAGLIFILVVYALWSASLVYRYHKAGC